MGHNKRFFNTKLTTMKTLAFIHGFLVALINLPTNPNNWWSGDKAKAYMNGWLYFQTL